jgi:hypothetical protein
MNSFESIDSNKPLSKPLAWSTTLILAALVTGCGGGADGGSPTADPGTSSSPTPTLMASTTVVQGAVGTASAAPTVSSASPSNNATNVPTSTMNSNGVVSGTAVTASFSQPMNPATLNSFPAGKLLTFTLKASSGNNVAGTVAMNAASTVATFTPTTAALAPNTSYTATVTKAARSATGTAMTNPVVWRFTTKAVASSAQAPVNLGTAGKFAILSKAGISTVPRSVVTGDIGVSPIAHTALTGFSETMNAANTFSTSTQVTGKIYAVDYTPPTPTYMTAAVSDMEIAYTDAAGRKLPTATELGAGQIGGLTLVPGLYKWGTSLLISKDVTLSGGPNDVWIFQVAGNITQAAATKVILTGGALAKNVFWQSVGAVAIGTTAHFEGVILSKTSIALRTGASINGRLLAQTAVTLDQSTVAQPLP